MPGSPSQHRPASGICVLCSSRCLILRLNLRQSSARTSAPQAPSQQCFDPLQVWLALNNLLVDPHCRAKYNLDDFRKEQLFRLRRFLNDLLLDQLPVLRDMQRMLDELALQCQPNLEGYSKGALVIEQVPMTASTCLLVAQLPRDVHRQHTHGMR